MGHLHRICDASPWYIHAISLQRPHHLSPVSCGGRWSLAPPQHQHEHSRLLVWLGPIAGKPAAQMHQLWPLHLGYTCMFEYVAIMRFQSIYFESRCGKAQLSSFSWLAPHVERLSFALMAMAGCKYVSTVVPSLGLLAYAMLLGAP